MAERSNGEDNEGRNSWWGGVGGWLQAAKETSVSAMDFVRRDLGEFTCTVQADTEHAVTATSNTVIETLKAENAATAKSRMKEGITILFKGITKVLTIPPDDVGQKPLLVVSQSAIYDRSKVRLHAIQVDPGTYLNKPSGQAEHFIEWCKHFDLDKKKGDVSELLVSKVEVRALYTKLVPAELAHFDFWKRYFYKLHQMSLDEARKQALLKRAERARQENNSINDDWGSGDEDLEIVELPETPTDMASPLRDMTPSPPVYLTVDRSPSSQKETPSSPQKETSSSPSTQSNSGPYEHGPKPDQLQTHANLKSDASKQNIPMKTESPVKTEKHPQNTSPLKTDAILQGHGEQFDSKVDTMSIEKKEMCANNQNSEFTESVPKPNKNTTTVENTESLTKRHLKEETSKMVDPQMEHNSGNKTENIDTKKLPEMVKTDTMREKEIDQSDSSVISETESKNAKVKEDKTDSAVKSEEKVAESSRTVESPSVLVEPPKIDESSSLVAESPGVILENEEKITLSLPDGESSDIKVKEKGDMVFVGSDRISPTSDSSGTKDPSTEDDWDKDFDLDVTEDDLKAAEELAKKMGEELITEDDWENWE